MGIPIEFTGMAQFCLVLVHHVLKLMNIPYQLSQVRTWVGRFCPTVTSLETEMQGIENLRMCCCLSVCFFCIRQHPVIFLEETGTFPQFFVTLKPWGLHVQWEKYGKIEFKFWFHGPAAEWVVAGLNSMIPRFCLDSISDRCSFCCPHERRFLGFNHNVLSIWALCTSYVLSAACFLMNKNTNYPKCSKRHILCIDDHACIWELSYLDLFDQLMIGLGLWCWFTIPCIIS